MEIEEEVVVADDDEKTDRDGELVDVTEPSSSSSSSEFSSLKSSISSSWTYSRGALFGRWYWEVDGRFALKEETGVDIAENTN